MSTTTIYAENVILNQGHKSTIHATQPSGRTTVDQKDSGNRSYVAIWVGLLILVTAGAAIVNLTGAW